ncbi:GNAT family N-acetyltransferase [Actinorugispora endophytica]|uniref:RimJ/RimL family protein N-acetyltransferase n=1 Tax=Actinorugispora endophytica TaxID=1605990 RepID=A0A4R6UGG6_9ACTN|nr:GNAT family N-acetyltransferase [Actinorugispora endophytica]TDQ45392.1 RimJ/RimL family protein N-acetyltransferase [Actinorugispora endophytica]
MTDPVLWLRGKTAAIGPIRADLVEEYWRWEQEIPTIVGYNRQTPQLIENTREIYTTAYENSSDRQIKFTLYDLTEEEPVPVGAAMLLIDPGCAVGEYTVAIGAADARGKGVGTEATRLVLDYAFHVTGLNCVYLTVLEPNEGAIKAYERAGFRRQGLRRNSNQWLGQKVNEVLMDAIPEEWEGPSLVKRYFQF